ncbi:hypothetical protein CC1G_00744 [Coprinopsis cinerea okayama7|uniref:Uncharacterized protein n=1 Tax=Coprinopsis cinerea (strain Okayama-7 / 130 / ATCC MYA-4618 / FGSC 9003) TaxID=240176 RepID=A8N9D0_COPC7|nr:hypothetical protein CC1G_00744 [Coprinopsis cinerea okayama7\|eukprot:XP_001831197.1 hypothetical protein CC1G_00744 [Coprinopsis cinerea okayama7\
MRDENRRMADQLCTERKRVDTLVNVVGRLWDVMNKSFPGSVGPFPQELIEAESPNIYITSPTATTSRYPPPLSMNIANPSLHGMHSHAMNSPSSSPTAADFPAHHHQQQQHHQLHPHHTHTLSRQHSFQHLSYSRGDGSGSGTPGSPGSVSMDLMDDFDPHHRNNKRPRLSADVNGLDSGGTPGSGDSIHLMSTMSSPATSTAASSLAAAKKAVRARSDSAPLGYTNSYTTGGHGGLGPWGAGGGLGAGLGGQAGRPRSGSGLGLGMGPRIPNINNMTRSGGGTPMLSIATVGDGMGR